MIVELDEMRCLRLDWLHVKDLDELKKLGNFKEVRAEIKKFGGKTIHVSGRSWKELLVSIEDFQKAIQQLNLSECKNLVDEAMVSPSSENTNQTVSESGYFTTKASEYIFFFF